MLIPRQSCAAILRLIHVRKGQGSIPGAGGGDSWHYAPARILVALRAFSSTPSLSIRPVTPILSVVRIPHQSVGPLVLKTKMLARV